MILTSWLPFDTSTTSVYASANIAQVYSSANIAQVYASANIAQVYSRIETRLLDKSQRKQSYTEKEVLGNFNSSRKFFKIQSKFKYRPVRNNDLQQDTCISLLQNYLAQHFTHQTVRDKFPTAVMNVGHLVNEDWIFILV
jgi:flagellar biosynthesis/type III secretory pathway ATPase